MVKIIQTSTLKKNDLPQTEEHNVYCGLDSCLTLEIFLAIHPQLDRYSKAVYGFSRALQAPVLSMMINGILTDTVEVNNLKLVYNRRLKRARFVLEKLSIGMSGEDLNPFSPKQVKAFFYDFMGLPKIYKWDKGVKKLSVNRDALEKIQDYRYARPVALAILTCRDWNKKIGVLKSGIDPDRRMRFSYNIGGTNTGRFSVNKNVFGAGTNANNITDELRRIFVARPGYKMAYIDLAQAESRGTAYIFGDEAYIEACESFDLHVYVAKLLWPAMDWSEKNSTAYQESELSAEAWDRSVADTKFYRHWSYRDISKRGGHLANYLGQAISNAKNLKVALDVMKRFLSLYLGTFHGIRRGHADTTRIIQTTQEIITPMGRRRIFFGRLNDEATIRKAVAYGPQSTISDILNIGMWRVWKYMRRLDVTVLTQLYDAILIEYPDKSPEFEEKVILEAIEHLTMPIQVTDSRYKNPKTRTMIIPADAVIGWNWAKGGEKNPDGLMPWKGRDQDKRTRKISPDMDLLKRPVA